MNRLWKGIAELTGRDDFSLSFEGEEPSYETLAIHWKGEPGKGEPGKGEPVEIDRDDLERVIMGYCLQCQREAALSLTQQLAEARRKELSCGAGAVEVASWPSKADRARRYIEGNISEDEKMALEAEAGMRGESSDELAHKQIKKACDYACALAYVDGWQKKTRHGVLTLAEGHNLIDYVKEQTPSLYSSLYSSGQ